MIKLCTTRYSKFILSTYYIVMEQQETKDRFLFMKKTKFLIEINKKIETKWKEKIPVEKDKIPVKNARNILIGEILFCM